MSEGFHRISTEAFQMREHHLELLMRNRSYLLHNLCPGETFWGALLEMGVFEADMLDEMKSQRTRSERVGMLLDLLPHRGPEAFDAFLEALLKCGHGFVADYLKILEVSDQFKTDIKSYNISDHIQDRLIRTYKKSLPNVQRFFETKLEVNLQEQETEFQDKEREITELETQTQTLESKIQETKQWFSECVLRTNTLGDELRRSYVLRSALREEHKNLETLEQKCPSDDKHEQLVSKFCDSMHSVIDYIETAEDRRTLLEHKLNCGDEEDDSGENGKFGTNGKTITSKVQGVIDIVASVMENTVGADAKEINMENDIRSELEKTVCKMREIIKDLSYVKRIFLTTLRKKEDLSQETLSLVHNFREIRRLEKEMNEKQGHIQELRTRGQTIKNKSKRHKRFLEQIQEEIAQKEKQLTELYDHLNKQVSSADQRVHFILSLLPDSGEEDGPKALADDTKSEGGFSLLSRDITYLSIVRDRSDSRFSLQSEKTDVAISRPQTTSTPAPPKTPLPNNHSQAAATETRVAPIQKPPKDTIDGKAKPGSENKVSNDSKSKSANKQSKALEVNGVKQLPKNSSSNGVETGKASNNPQTNKPMTASNKDPQSGRDTQSGKTETKSPPSSAKNNKVHPVQVQSNAQITNAGSSQRTNSSVIQAATEGKTKTETKKEEQKPAEPERKFTVGNVSSGLEMTTKDEAQTKVSDGKNQTSVIQVRPAEGSNTFHTRSAKMLEKEVKKPTNQFQPAHQRNLQTKPQTVDSRPTNNHQGSKLSNSTDRFASKSMEPLSISSARAGTTSNSDCRSPNVGDKSAAHRSPIPTPRFSIKSSQGQNRFDPNMLMSDRPVPTPRTKRMNSIEDKDGKSSNGASNPHIQTPKEDAKQPWSGVSSKQLLRPQNGENDSTLASCTFPPSKKQSRAKSMDHVMLGTRPSSNNRQVTQNESVYNRVSDAINKVKDRTAASKKEQLANGVSASDSRAMLANPRLSLSTESSDGQVGDLWLHSSSSDECNILQDNTDRSDTGGHIGNSTQRVSSSILSQQQVKAELDLEDSKFKRPRTMSAETHSSARSRYQGEDPNKYPQRQILMANKVQLK